MTIASEITALNTNLTAAKNAVTAKGGTVGDTGLAGLADEIATIPTGGGTLDNYGTITYKDASNVEHTVTLATELDFEHLTFSATIPLTINGVPNIYKNKITSVTIADGVQYLPADFLGGCEILTSVTLPSSVQYIGTRFMQNCSAFNAPLNLAKVGHVDGFFLASCSSFNQPIDLPKIEYIGSGFLQSCGAFNSDVTLGNDLFYIGGSFMLNCSAFAKSITIPASLDSTYSATNPGTKFMNGCWNFTGPLVCNGPITTSAIPNDNNTLSPGGSNWPAYTTGITLTGTYASQWKSALPDRSSSPYRKLILGS